MKSATIPQQKCSQCGYTLTNATELEKVNILPQEGDVSICLNCGDVAIYGPGLILRKLTIRERMNIYKGCGGRKIAVFRRLIWKRGKFYHGDN